MTFAWLQKLRDARNEDEYERGYKDTAYILLKGIQTPLNVMLDRSGESPAYERGRTAATLRFLELRLKS